MRHNKPYKVLVVGQTPPPYGGQAIMIETTVRAPYKEISIYHVRMMFSESMSQMGKIHLRKFLHLVSVITQIIWIRLRHGTQVLYYPPSGPNKAPMYRDFAILICTRWLFRKTVFHFHAGGVSELYPTLSAMGRFLFRRAYFNPDASIMLASTNPPDGQTIKSKTNYIVPYGIKDCYSDYKLTQNSDSCASILFMGVLRESKGVRVLIEALKLLKEREVEFKATLVGEFGSDSFRETIMTLLSDWGIGEYVELPGVLTGDKKWTAFSKADIFGYPTFFESETFGLVVLEAMQFELPVVVSKWRGVPTLVENDKTGFTIPIKNSTALADKLQLLIQDPENASAMGRKGRDRYLSHYSLDTYIRTIEETLTSVCQDQS